MTVRVTVVEWVLALAPLPEVPVTVRVYVPGGVPVPPLLTIPAHPAPTNITSISAIPTAIRARCCFLLSILPINIIKTISPSTRILSNPLPPITLNSRPRGASITIPCAVVWIVTVAVTALVPLGVTIPGLTVQLAAVGAPLHPRLTP